MCIFAIVDNVVSKSLNYLITSKSRKGEKHEEIQ